MEVLNYFHFFHIYNINIFSIKMTELAIKYTNDLQSNEGQKLLKKISKFSDKIEEALNFDFAIKEIRSLSDSEFYTSCLLRKEVSRLNEAEAIQMVASGAEAEIDNVISNSGSVPTGSGSGGILGMLKSLWNTLTEGGSPIGILQLILDFVGLVGDAFLVVGIPLGMVADFINGMIYFFRGKYVLGIISLIAMIPFGGDVAKGFKGVAHLFSKPFSKLFTKGAGKTIAKESAEVMIKQEGKAFGKSKRFLEFIKKSASKIAANVASAISFLLENVIAKVVGWIPGLGKPLKKFILRIADYGRIVADNLLGFAKTVDGPIAKEISEQAAKNFDTMEKALASGGKVVKEGDHLIVTVGKGAPKKIPIDNIASWSNISKKFPDGPMKKILKSSDDVAKYYEFISKTGGAARKFIQRNADVIIVRGLVLSKFQSFIAKQIVKLLGSSGKALSDYEKDGISNIMTNKELNDRMDDHIENEKKRKKSLIDVPYIDQQLKDNPDTDDVDESGLAQDLQNHLNYRAKQMGMDDFPQYIYAKAKAEKEDEITDLYVDHSISTERYNELMGYDTNNSKNPIGESMQYSSNFKYIKPFSAF